LAFFPTCSGNGQRGGLGLLDSAETRTNRPLMGDEISSIPPTGRQGMQLVSSGYNPVLMQKGMKASDPMASGPGRCCWTREGVMINQSIKNSLAVW